MTLGPWDGERPNRELDAFRAAQRVERLAEKHAEAIANAPSRQARRQLARKGIR